ncbi:hypothetical protein GALL_254280 [mine drainage metagenome]|uniref:Uncharacterized protein n=1 Tax=mine drainage metagenome TaxID=410659 RepID=A0A1J5RWU6_9ZZZZ
MLMPIKIKCVVKCIQNFLSNNSHKLFCFLWQMMQCHIGR